MKINQIFLFGGSLCLNWTAGSGLLRTCFPWRSLGPVGTFQMKSSKLVANIKEIMGFPLTGNSVDIGMGITVSVVDVLISVVI